MSNAVICIARTQLQAESLLRRLKDAVGSAADISLLLLDRPDQTPAGEVAARSGDTSSYGSGAGGIAGGIFGLLAGVGFLAIPGAGLFIAAGPIIAALSGAALGAAVGGISGALMDMGIPERQARVYEDLVRDGGALLSVRTYRNSDLKRIKRIMEWAHAEEIAIAAA